MNIAVILSGGIGNRMGMDIPKQYSMVRGTPIVSFCMKQFIDNQRIDLIAIVAADEWRGLINSELNKICNHKPVLFAQPGETRQYSIFNALSILNDNNVEDDDIVIIHDAARPLVSQRLINDCLDGCEEADGVMPVVPVKDTIYYSTDGNYVEQLLDRNFLKAGQAPEAFRFGKYYGAHLNMSREDILKINGSTEMAVRSGLHCLMIDGDPMNFKITTPEDLSAFESLLNKKDDLV